MRHQLQAMNELFTKQLEALRGTAPLVPAGASTNLDTLAPIRAATVPASGTFANSPRIEAAATVDGFKPHGPYRPVQKTGSADLTPHQTTSLNELIARHTKRGQQIKGPDADIPSGSGRPTCRFGFPLTVEGNSLPDCHGALSRITPLGC